MSMQTLNQAEMNEVSGGLILGIGGNPILNGALDFTPGGVFTLLGSLVASAKGFLGGLL